MESASTRQAEANAAEAAGSGRAFTRTAPACSPPLQSVAGTSAGAATTARPIVPPPEKPSPGQASQVSRGTGTRRQTYSPGAPYPRRAGTAPAASRQSTNASSAQARGRTSPAGPVGRGYSSHHVHPYESCSSEVKQKNLCVPSGLHLQPVLVADCRAVARLESDAVQAERTSRHLQPCVAGPVSGSGWLARLR